MALAPPTLQDYINAASEYVRASSRLGDGAKKAAQIRLSAGLGAVLLAELRTLLPLGAGAVSGEHPVSGALRTVNADVSESDALHGLRMAVEIKPVNLAVGRNIWNRFGDIRTFGVNLHLKFPFAVVGGILTIPTYEEATRAGVVTRRDTTHLITRAVNRLVRAGGRITEGDPPHLLEAVAVVVYDPDTSTLRDDVPPQGSGLRWPDFIFAMASTYQARFVD